MPVLMEIILCADRALGFYYLQVLIELQVIDYNISRVVMYLEFLMPMKQGSHSSSTPGEDHLLSQCILAILFPFCSPSKF